MRSTTTSPERLTPRPASPMRHSGSTRPCAPWRSWTCRKSSAVRAAVPGGDSGRTVRVLRHSPVLPFRYRRAVRRKSPRMKKGRHVVHSGVKVSSYLRPSARKTEGIVGQPAPQWLFRRSIGGLFRSASPLASSWTESKRPLPGRTTRSRRPLARHAGHSASSGRPHETGPLKGLGSRRFRGSRTSLTMT